VNPAVPEQFAERLVQCLGKADCDIAPITESKLAEELSKEVRETGARFKNLKLVDEVAEKERPDYDVAHDVFVRQLAQSLYDVREAKKFGYGLGLVRVSPRVALARIGYEKLDAKGRLHLNQTGFLVFWLNESGWQLVHWSKELPSWVFYNKPAGFEEADLSAEAFFRLAKEVTNGAHRRQGVAVGYGIELGERGCAKGLQEACNWVPQVRKLGSAKSLEGKKGASQEERAKAWALYEEICPIYPGAKILGVVGVGRGCFEMAKAAREGRGTEKNLPLSRKAMEKACELGNPSGCGTLYNWTLKDSKESAERTQAMQRVKDACESGSAMSCGYIDEALGLGQRNRKRSLDNDALGAVLDATRRKCFGGDLPACYRLGLTYIMGSEDKAKQDIPRGIGHMLRACDYGHGYSCSALGNFHDGNEGIFTKDVDHAVYYYKKACSGKRPEVYGCSLLGKLMRQLPSTDMYPELLEAALASKKGCELKNKYSCSEFKRYHKAVTELYGFPLEGTPTMGAEGAWVTVVVAMSAADRRWGELFHSLKSLVEKHGDEGIRVAVYPSFDSSRPVPGKLDMALLCAAKTGHYWETLEDIAEFNPKPTSSYRRQRTLTTMEKLERLRHGASLASCSAEASVAERISKIASTIEQLKLPFRGAVFVNGRLSKVPGSGMAELEALIEEELERAKESGAERVAYYETKVMADASNRVDGATYGLGSLEMMSAEDMKNFKMLQAYWHNCNEDKRDACKSGASLAVRAGSDKAYLFQTRDELLGCHTGDMDQCDALMARTSGTQKCHELDARRQVVFHRCWFEPGHGLCQNANRVAEESLSEAPCGRVFR